MSTRTVDIYGKEFVVVRNNRLFWETVIGRKWDPDLVTLLDKYLDKGTWFLDVGAWIGPVSLYASSLAGHVCCVEPDPTAAITLEINMKRNVSQGHYSIVKAALSSNSDDVCLHSRGKGGLGRSMTSIYGTGKANVTVPAIGLRDVFCCEGKPELTKTFMKMDIEGAEAEIIPHEIAFIREKNMVVCLALHWYLIPEHLRSALVQAMYTMEVRNLQENLIAERDIYNDPATSVLLIPK